jgi:3-dehydroquinate dehydratase
MERNTEERKRGIMDEPPHSCQIFDNIIQEFELAKKDINTIINDADWGSYYSILDALQAVQLLLSEVTLAEVETARAANAEIRAWGSEWRDFVIMSDVL